MLLPKNIEQKLGFDQIKEIILKECLCELGRKHVQKLRFSDKDVVVKKRLLQTAEFKSILSEFSDFPSQNYLDASDHIKKIQIEGFYLDETEFFDLKASLLTIQQIFYFFKKHGTDLFPTLFDLYESALPSPNGWQDLIKKIDSVIDERAKVRDNASVELGNIRRKLSAEQREVQKTLERIYRTAKNSGWISEEMSLTVRDGRLVIPVLAEHKRKLNGFVHDETASGQIAFVEPGEVLQANNEIRDLEIRERREVIKILVGLSDHLRPFASSLDQSFQFLGQIDFIRAKAKLALKIGADLPIIENQPALDWHRAVHPLLFLTHKKEDVVPLTIRLDQNKRVILVSGPNAGGKSVLLKTLGLLQYMMQCGILVPMSPDSTMGIFQDLFIDIGDEQSIENDLSTYSSHLTAMKHFLQNAGNKSLFLIDEFGSGTEPNVGGALAESILENLLQSGSMGVVNTHYTNLKVFADSKSGVVNAAMKFDAEALTPLFALSIGQPGSSFAFEIAEKIGLPKGILKNAKSKLDSAQLNFENLLGELEKEKKSYADRNAEIQKETNELKLKMEQYKALKTFLDSEQKRILNKAKEDAKGLLSDANKKIEQTIKIIKEEKADKESTMLARKAMETFKHEKLVSEKAKAPVFVKDDTMLKVGDYVQIQGQEAVGQVLSMGSKEAEISIGVLKSNIKLSRLQKVSHKTQKKVILQNMRGISLNDKMANFTYSVDIRGKRGEEALVAVNGILDDAIMLGYPEIRIIHGKGDGILRNLVRTHLKTYKQIKSISDEHADRGGQGISIIQMN